MKFNKKEYCINHWGYFVSIIAHNFDYTPGSLPTCLGNLSLEEEIISDTQRIVLIRITINKGVNPYQKLNFYKNKENNKNRSIIEVDDLKSKGL